MIYELFNPKVPDTRTVDIDFDLWVEVGNEATKRLMKKHEFVAQALKYALEHLPERFDDEVESVDTETPYYIYRVRLLGKTDDAITQGIKDSATDPYKG